MTEMAKKNLDIRKWSAGKLSSVVLYSITALTAFVFLLFYSVGYNMPSPWNESINSPLLTDLVIVLILIMLLSSFAVTMFSKYRSLKVSHTDDVVNGINGKRVTRIVVLLVVLVMALSFLFLPFENTKVIDGKVYSEEIWLRMANMFVFTSIALILAGLAVIFFATIKNRRLRNAVSSKAS